MASRLAISLSARARTGPGCSPLKSDLSRIASCPSKARCACAMPSATLSISDGVAAAISRVPAATSVPLYLATPNAAASSGTVPSLTLLCTSPTRSKEYQPTKLAAMVSSTAPPMPAYSWADRRNRRCKIQRICPSTTAHPAACSPDSSCDHHRFSSETPRLIPGCRHPRRRVETHRCQWHQPAQNSPESTTD